MANTPLDRLRAEIAACRICRDVPDSVPLPHEPRPVAVLSGQAKIRIVGQAPGTRVHQSGRPFTDPSGNRLRDWMGISEEDFYNPKKLAITPMGFCFPGLDKNGSDLPPRRECAKTWHAKLDEAMPQVRLLLLIGHYAQKHYLDCHAKETLTETVHCWREYYDRQKHPRVVVLPHPSWRNNAWIARNPWFARDLLPVLKGAVAETLQIE